MSCYVLIIFLVYKIHRGMIIFSFKKFLSFYTFFHLKFILESCSLACILVKFLFFDFRTKIAQDIERLIYQSDIIDRVVYDLDNPK